MSSAQKRKSVNDGAAPAKRPKLDYTQSLTVLVGPDEDSFQVYKKVICSKSKFFEAACRKGWKEGEEKLVRLPDMSPYSFTVYLHWLYTQTIAYEDIEYDPPFKAEWDAVIDEEDSEHDIALSGVDFIHLFCAYITGDVLQDMELTNHAMTECIRLCNTSVVPWGQYIAYAWNNTPEHSRLRRWIIDSVPNFQSPRFFGKVAVQVPQDCLVEMSKAMAQYIYDETTYKGHFPALKDACKYHDHTDDPDTCPYASSTKDSASEQSDESEQAEESSSADSESSDED